MAVSLDCGIHTSDNSFFCRACKRACHDFEHGRLAGLPVCERCRNAYCAERNAAELAVDDRWIAKLYSEEAP